MTRSRSLAISKIQGTTRTVHTDLVAVEEPLEIRLGYSTPRGRTARSVSITMRTPGDDIDLALGFLYGESIIEDLDDVVSAEFCGPPAPDTGTRNIVRIELGENTELDLSRIERHFYTTSSCGVCGKSSLEALAIHSGKTLANDATRFGASMLSSLPDLLQKQQLIFDQTGGLHAAALFDSQGELLLVREDVGRHNAVDKVIGSRFAAGKLPAGGHGLLVSGRASFELMQKAMRAGIPLLAAVGAPSSLAVSVAQEFGMTLVGFLRDGRFNIYANEQRVH